MNNHFQAPIQAIRRSLLPGVALTVLLCGSSFAAVTTPYADDFSLLQQR